MSWGLVLNGGGGKGAYQIGVWRHFLEQGATFDYISGSSAGALNAALIGLGPSGFEKSKNLWTSLDPSKIYKVDPKKLVFIVKELIKFFALKRSKSLYLSLALITKGGRNILAFVLKEGVVSIAPLVTLIDNNLDYYSYPDHPEIYITTVRNHPILLFEGSDYINFTEAHPLIKRRLLLASSAIPLLFPSTNIGNIRYSDGGIPLVGDNSPISPLYRKKCKNIVVIHLSPNGRTDKRNYPGSNIYDVVPSEPLGGLLQFDGNHAGKLLELGYRDAKEQLKGKV